MPVTTIKGLLAAAREAGAAIGQASDESGQHAQAASTAATAPAPAAGTPGGRK